MYIKTYFADELNTFNPDKVCDGAGNSNGERASIGSLIIDYAEIQSPSGEEDETQAVDAITNILHACHEKGWNINDVLTMAVYHFSAETNEE